MDKKTAILSRKYALAFVHVFGDQLTTDDILNCAKAEQRLSEYKQLNFFLRMPFIDDHLKRNALTTILHKAKLPESFDRLLHLLLEHKRSFLLDAVLRWIQSMSMDLKNIASFDIASSHALTEEQYQDLTAFLTRTTGRTIISKQTIDPTLLAGLSMKSETLRWEHSLKSYLQRARLLAHDLRT